MEVVQLSETVFQLTLPIVNVFLVDHPSGLILIDCGPKGSKDLIFEGIKKIGKQPADLKYILLTHAHHDHAGGLASILKTITVPVYASALCAERIKKGIAFQIESKILNFLLKLFTLFGLIRLQFLYIQPVNATIYLLKQDDFVPNNSGLQVYEAPGHCAEQLAFFYPVKEALLFAADCAENSDRLKPAFSYQSASINRITLNKLAALPFKLAVFGHGKVVRRSEFEKTFA